MNQNERQDRDRGRRADREGWNVGDPRPPPVPGQRAATDTCGANLHMDVREAATQGRQEVPRTAASASRLAETRSAQGQMGTRTREQKWQHAGAARGGAQREARGSRRW